MKRIILTGVTFFLTLCAVAQNKGIVDVSVAHLREVPDYTGEQGTEALMGTVVDLIGAESYWLQVVTPDGYKAWTNGKSISVKTDEEISEYEKADKMMCITNYSIIYTEPSVKSQPISDLVKQDLVINLKTVKKGFLKVSTPSGRTGWVPKKHLMDYELWKSTRHYSGDNAVKEAMLYVGIPYLWGGTSVKGFDCSGLVVTAYRWNGVYPPRNASQMAKLGTLLECDGKDFSNVRPGDLIFFGNIETGKVTHVAMYIGNNHIIHSSHLVRVNSMIPGEPDYYENAHRFLFARRLYE